MLPDTEYNRWAFEAKHNGIPLKKFKRRVQRLGFGGERAATQPLRKEKRIPAEPKNPNSIAYLCFENNVNRKSYYNVREELMDMGIEATKQDIIDICKARAKR